MGALSSEECQTREIACFAVLKHGSSQLGWPQNCRLDKGSTEKWTQNPSFINETHVLGGVPLFFPIRLRVPRCLWFALVVARVVCTNMGLTSFWILRSIGSKSFFVVSLFLLCLFGESSHLTISCCVHRSSTCLSVYFTLIGWCVDQWLGWLIASLIDWTVV